MCRNDGNWLFRKDPYAMIVSHKGIVQEAANIKQEAHHLLENLPENATWDDLMYRIYVRQAIEAGLEDSIAGRTVNVKDVRAKFGRNVVEILPSPERTLEEKPC